MIDSPLISVLLPFYNSERYLELAIQSIVNQTYTCFELLLLDDGSKDSSLTIAQDFALRDPRIIIHSHPNMGLCKTLRKGVFLAQGKYIARMDADDIAEPTRFQLQVDYLEQNPDCVALGTALTVIDPDGDILDEPPITQEHNQLVKELLQWKGARICHPTVMMRTEQVREVGGYSQEYHFEDVDLFLKLARCGKLANLPERLLQYRWHISSISHTREQVKINEIKQQIIQRSVKDLRLAWEDSENIQTNNKTIDITSKAQPYNSQYEAYCRWCLIAHTSGFYKSSWKYLCKLFQIEPFASKTYWVLANLVIGREWGNALWKGLWSMRQTVQKLIFLKNI